MGNMDEQHTDKCCASLTLSEKFSDGNPFYMYRCLNRGLIDSHFSFLIPGTLVQVEGYCEEPENGRAPTSTTIAAVVASVATMAFTYFKNRFYNA